MALYRDVPVCGNRSGKGEYFPRPLPTSLQRCAFHRLWFSFFDHLGCCGPPKRPLWLFSTDPPFPLELARWRDTYSPSLAAVH